MATTAPWNGWCRPTCVLWSRSSKKYQGTWVCRFPTLINEGNLGLMTAAERFDHTKGFKFISYAVWWIRQNIIKAVQDTGRAVRIPVQQAGCHVQGAPEGLGGSGAGV